MGCREAYKTDHGFQRASSILRGQGFNMILLSCSVVHSESNDSSSTAYNAREYLSKRTEMMQEWADYIDTSKKHKIITLYFGKFV